MTSEDMLNKENQSNSNEVVFREQTLFLRIKYLISFSRETKKWTQSNHTELISFVSETIVPIQCPAGYYCQDG